MSKFLGAGGLARAEILQAMEDALIDHGAVEMMWTTEHGSFERRTKERDRERMQPDAPPGLVTAAGLKRAMELLFVANGDQAELAQLIAREFASQRRR